MGQFFDEMSADQQDWIHKQKMFIVASAPLAATGTVNASPKGYDCFRIIDANKACYLEMTGMKLFSLSLCSINCFNTSLVFIMFVSPLSIPCSRPNYHFFSFFFD